jgi:hypothetical protein
MIGRLKSVKWTPQQASEWDSELRELTRARYELVMLTRRDSGNPVGDVLGQQERQADTLPRPSHRLPEPTDADGV